MELKTERLRIVTLTPEQVLLLIENLSEFEQELRVKYCGESIEGHLLKATKEQYSAAIIDKDNYIWHTFWQFILRDKNIIIGSACFKGLPDKTGDVEIGYGINTPYQNKGYTTEAIDAMCKWGLKQRGVKRIIAETEKDNIPSYRVLQKCGMKRYKETEECFWWSFSISE